MKTKEIANTYKYTLWYKLQQHPSSIKRDLLMVLPELLNVSEGTFRNWTYYKKEDQKYIPAHSLYQLSTFFGCPLKEMWTDPPQSLEGEFNRIKQDHNN